jgi:hypothetical protein
MVDVASVSPNAALLQCMFSAALLGASSGDRVFPQSRKQVEKRDMHDG